MRCLHFFYQLHFIFRKFEIVGSQISQVWVFSQERGEHVPPEYSFDVAQRIKEMYCYTCSDIIKVTSMALREDL